jgi:hypothetical protein
MNDLQLELALTGPCYFVGSDSNASRNKYFIRELCKVAKQIVPLTKNLDDLCKDQLSEHSVKPKELNSASGFRQGQNHQDREANL